LQAGTSGEMPKVSGKRSARILSRLAGKSITGRVMLMRAVVKKAPGPGFQLMDLEPKALGRRDVLVK